MRYLMRLGSGYAMRIYELLKSRRYRGHKVRFDIEDLQSILGTKDKYQRFNNFRSRVLDVACEEINARTDIKVSFEIEPHKSDRRKAGTVVFNVSDRAGGSVTALPVAGHELVTRLTHAGLPEIEAMKIVEQFGGTDRERITWHLDEVGARVAAHTVKSPAAWLRAGIRADYRPQRSPLERELEDKAKRMADEKAGRERAVTADKARREADDDAAAKKHERVRRHIAQVVAALSDTARRDVIAAVEQRLAAGVLRETWNRKPDLGSVVYQKLITDAILDITGLDARRE